jgi:hypothetical protein
MSIQARRVRERAEREKLIVAAARELAEALRPHVPAEDLGLLTKTFWAALHGLVTLTRGGRLPRHAHDDRLGLLLNRFASPRGR